VLGLDYGDCECKDVGWVVLVAVRFLEVVMVGFVWTVDGCGKGTVLRFWAHFLGLDWRAP